MNVENVSDSTSCSSSSSSSSSASSSCSSASSSNSSYVSSYKNNVQVIVHKENSWYEVDSDESESEQDEEIEDEDIFLINIEIEQEERERINAENEFTEEVRQIIVELNYARYYNKFVLQDNPNYLKTKFFETLQDSIDDLTETIDDYKPKIENSPQLANAVIILEHMHNMYC